MKGPIRSALIGVLAATGVAGCGTTEERLVPPDLNSPQVALTVDYPGAAPLALITYRSRRVRCHALGTMTARGARLLGQLGKPVSQALPRHGRCLDAAHPVVSLQVGDAGNALRAVGGITRDDVVRVAVAGQRVRPRDGAFLVAFPASAGAVGQVVRVQLRDGRRLRLPLQQLLG
jgi:CBS domain-containing protein